MTVSEAIAADHPSSETPLYGSVEYVECRVQHQEQQSNPVMFDGFFMYPLAVILLSSASGEWTGS